MDTGDLIEAVRARRVLEAGFEPADDFNPAAERYGRGLLASV